MAVGDAAVDDTVMPSRDEESAVRALREFLDADGQPLRPQLVGPDDETIELPEPVYRVLREVVDAMARGQGVTLVPRNTKLTTQDAADVLGISRPTLVRLLEAGKIRYEQPRRHRYVRLADVIDYQRRMRRERRDGLRRMAEEGQEAGLYDGAADTPPATTR